MDPDPHFKPTDTDPSLLVVSLVSYIVYLCTLYMSMVIIYKMVPLNTLRTGEAKQAFSEDENQICASCRFKEMP